jgi:hypothetical protein
MENHSQNGRSLLVGAAKRTITPTVTGRRVFIAGDDIGRRAEDIHDELWARAVAVRKDTATLVVISLDLLGFAHEHVSLVRDRALEAKLPADHVIITCTRNHAGPDTTGQWSTGWPGSGLNYRYVQFLHRELVEMIRLAVEALTPALAFFARCPGPNLFDEQEPRELAAIQFRTPQDKTIATIVNYPLVPQVLGQENTSISADFCTWLYQELEAPERSANSDQVTLYTCAEADESPPPAFQARSWQEAERIGRGLAVAVREALDGIIPTEIERLHIWKKAMPLPAGDAATRLWRRVRTLSGDGPGRFAESEVGLVQLGPARMAAVPGLIAPQIGIQVRKMLDAPYRFVLGVSNDDLGYIPPQDTSAPGAAARGRSQVGTIVLDELDRLLLDARRMEAQQDTHVAP